MGREELARELLSAARELSAIRSDGDLNDPYSEEEMAQILRTIEDNRRNSVSLSRAIDIDLKNALSKMEDMKDVIEDIVWGLGVSGDRDVRKSQAVLKSLENHIDTVEKLRDYVRRIGKWA